MLSSDAIYVADSCIRILQCLEVCAWRGVKLSVFGLEAVEVIVSSGARAGFGPICSASVLPVRSGQEGSGPGLVVGGLGLSVLLSVHRVG